ncbi:uncharacterized protein LOC115625473 [Scaptodrosophila lebanonensis]|uniref:Uncharacterized protein LOC115625473 n=1 Tax=Drosophila lebanonensis TaxID=7225 RepID=A0A6J2TN21_DROLE|nr:uncharacterized protein LOC115625473 [Scaptodrosophila lebanonensis]
MMNPHYPECRALPAINETFPQFSQSRPAIALLSPLDLSLRAANIIPITPPSTPSPPRKRQRLMSEENYLWRPHAMAATQHHATLGGGPAAPYNKSHFQETKNNFEEIPASQSSVPPPAIHPSLVSTQQQGQQLPSIYVEDETIVLTEDEDETVVSSHDYNEDTDMEEGVSDEQQRSRSRQQQSDNEVDDDEEEVYVDILSNDDEDDDLQNPSLRLQAQLVEAKALKRNELTYDDEELHIQAVDGLARLFERDFSQPAAEQRSPTETATIENSDKIYTDLGSGSATTPVNPTSATAPKVASTGSVAPLAPPRTHKPERKRTKLRKHTAIDEETISPVSGTIIRKLRDDEELVVRKGDIDPAFNVVEITEEAKAILASIDNKIGAYLCQLCRTLYDDAFMLAQHRCPRIVHIEYKCSECEKVFNCPANLASHRRWHKPKTEALTGSQGNKKSRQNGSDSTASNNSNSSSVGHPDKPAGEDAGDGIYPCHHCGKTFRRHAYLKKHQASHQILENLKTFDFFKAQSQQQTVNANFSQPASAPAPYTLFSGAHGSPVQLPRPAGVLYPSPKNYAQRFAGFPHFQPFDQRRLYSLGELYLSQHFERSSAFQYVQANHLRQLSNVANNMLPTLPVK